MQVAIPETLFTYSRHDHNVEAIVQHGVDVYFEDAKIVLARDRSMLTRNHRQSGDSAEYADLKMQGYVFLCYADKMRVQGKQNDYVIVVKPTEAVKAWFKKYIGVGVGSVEVTEPAGNVIFKSNDRTLSTSHLAGSISLDEYKKYLNAVKL